MEDNSNKLGREDMEALRSLHDSAAEETDRDGWSRLKKEHLMAGLAIAGVAAVGLGVAALMGAFNSKKNDRERRR
jgi:hypothetical protein